MVTSPDALRTKPWLRWVIGGVIVLVVGAGYTLLNSPPKVSVGEIAFIHAPGQRIDLCGKMVTLEGTADGAYGSSNRAYYLNDLVQPAKQILVIVGSADSGRPPDSGSRISIRGQLKCDDPQAILSGNTSYVQEYTRHPLSN